MTNKKKKSRDEKIFTAFKLLENAIKCQEADIKITVPWIIRKESVERFSEALKKFIEVYESVSGKKPTIQLNNEV